MIALPILIISLGCAVRLIGPTPRLLMNVQPSQHWRSYLANGMSRLHAGGTRPGTLRHPAWTAVTNPKREGRRPDQVDASRARPGPTDGWDDGWRQTESGERSGEL